MFTTSGYFRGTGGPSGHGIFFSKNGLKLGDEMYEAFHQVGERPHEGANQKRQLGRSYAELLSFLGKCPWLLNQYPLVFFGMINQYPWMFTPKTLEDNGYKHTLH